jgi:hypothetical protein
MVAALIVGIVRLSSACPHLEPVVTEGEANQTTSHTRQAVTGGCKAWPPVAVAFAVVGALLPLSCLSCCAQRRLQHHLKRPCRPSGRSSADIPALAQKLQIHVGVGPDTSDAQSVVEVAEQVVFGELSAAALVWAVSEPKQAASNGRRPPPPSPHRAPRPGVARPSAPPRPARAAPQAAAAAAAAQAQPGSSSAGASRAGAAPGPASLLDVSLSVEEKSAASAAGTGLLDMSLEEGAAHGGVAAGEPAATARRQLCEVVARCRLPAGSGLQKSTSLVAGRRRGAVSHSCACIGSPCLGQCVHGALIGRRGGASPPAEGTPPPPRDAGSEGELCGQLACTGAGEDNGIDHNKS